MRLAFDRQNTTAVFTQSPLVLAIRPRLMLPALRDAIACRRRVLRPERPPSTFALEACGGWQATLLIHIHLSRYNALSVLLAWPIARAPSGPTFADKLALRPAHRTPLAFAWCRAGIAAYAACTKCQCVLWSGGAERKSIVPGHATHVGMRVFEIDWRVGGVMPSLDGDARQGKCTGLFAARLLEAHLSVSSTVTP